MGSVLRDGVNRRSYPASTTHQIHSREGAQKAERVVAVGVGNWVWFGLAPVDSIVLVARVPLRCGQGWLLRRRPRSIMGAFAEMAVTNLIGARV